MTRIVGLDLSLTATGIAVIDDGQIRVTTCGSKGTNADTLHARNNRLSLMRHLVGELIYPGITLAVVEAPDTSRATGKVHDRSGLWWLIVSELLGNYVNVAEVPPSVLKKYATGKGNAAKDDVLMAVARRWPDVELRDNNGADALILAAMGARHLGHPIDELPQTHLAAMDKVHWPTEVVA
jgi:crossover junction endodeoxyribonuclease RuvC